MAWARKRHHLVEIKQYVKAESFLFDVSVLHYLIKPVDERKLCFVLDITEYITSSEIARNILISMWYYLNYRFNVDPKKMSTLYEDQVHIYKYTYPY